MRVRFWGTRGSLAKPGPATVRYGGNTSCVEVTTGAGTRLVIDCGTGGHELGQAIMREGRPSRGHMLISHTHWDHIQGIPFFTPFFAAGHQWDVYAPQGFGESLRDTLAGQMEYTYFPVTPEAFGARVRYTNLGEGRFAIDDAVIHTRYLNHPALTLAFRIEADGAAMVYSCDHEPHSRTLAVGPGPVEGEDLAHATFMTGADLVIHDAQYLAAEYDAKAGWGHSTMEYAVTIGRAAGVRRLALTHHDPLRTDDQIDAAMERLRLAVEPDMAVFAAAEGMEIVLEGGAALPSDSGTGVSAIREGAAAETPLLLLAACDEEVVDKIARAVADEPVLLERAESGTDALALFAALRPALFLIAGDMPDMSAAALAGAAGAARDGGAVPVVILGGDGPLPDGAADRLAEPWSVEYARTRIRTWLIRAECHWTRAPIPRDEALRLQALRALAILDTPPEEAFDRHTRLAAALFRTPVALVSLVDADRQWFKSCYGTDVCESSRETSFCAHAVAARALLIVPDTLTDVRFRDNPMVSGGPRIRFYAGAPILSPGGHCVGTLCVLDMRPRSLSAADQDRLRDLAALVETELARRTAPLPNLVAAAHG